MRRLRNCRKWTMPSTVSCSAAGRKVPDEKEVKRTVDALIRRGHSWKDIQSGLRRYRVGLELEEITEDDIS